MRVILANGTPARIQQPDPRSDRQQGFMLVGLIVTIFLILLVLSVAAPRVATGLKRDRELEAIHRGNQYVRAIQLYQRKFPGRYPGSMEQLEKSNNVRFLRQRFADPMTGKDDWRLIPVGQNKTTVKGLFGQPLAGLAGGGPGSVGGTNSGIGGSSSPTNGANNPSPSLGTPSAIGAPGSPGASAGSASTTDAGTPGTSGTPGSTNSQSASDFKGGAQPFMGVGSQKPGDSVIVLNEQTTYLTWEFIYDPRIEKLKAVNALGGTPASSGLGSPAGSPSPTTTPAPGASTPNPTGPGVTPP